ncbi:hypothetical protein CUMW_256130 [Citrus unshiu]|uniref:Uncharacterized protein n=1 Tax=Citrus unshiu TaxID=55188 RepID=A0A2H5QS12_CITUN|nr:hypothetical protein CUMW_256130 [Citrus unshiu]
MKLSLKLPDDSQNTQNPPILKVKIPITIFNQPFISYLTTTTTTTKTVAADSQHLSFSLGTNFPSGPSFKLNYSRLSTTCTSTTPFSFSLKSGLGLFGSPQDSPLIFYAHFSLSYTNPTNFTPTFLLHFKPQFGNFSLHKTTLSSNSNPANYGLHLQSGSPSNTEFANRSISDESSGWQDLKLEPRNGNGNGRFFNGVDSIRSDGIGVMMNLRWGVNLLVDSEVKMPCLTLNKIGIERVEKVEEVKRGKNFESDISNFIMREEEIEKLRGLVRDCVSKHLYSSAIFFANEVAALTNDPADVYMQAQALFLGRHYRRPFHLLNSSKIVLRDLRFRYLAAKCLEELRSGTSVCRCSVMLRLLKMVMFMTQRISMSCFGMPYRKSHANMRASKATNLDGTFAPAWIGYGNAFAAQEEGDQAMLGYRTAACLFPGCHLPTLYIGMEYMRTHSFKLAEQAKTICPSDPLVYNELGVVAYHMKDVWFT